MSMFGKLSSSFLGLFRPWHSIAMLCKQVKEEKKMQTKLKDMFFNYDFKGMEEALNNWANPNIKLRFYKSPNYVPYCFKEEAHNLFSKQPFYITFVDILSNKKWTSIEDRKMYHILISHGGHTTDEGNKAFEYWKKVEDVVDRDKTPEDFYCQNAGTCPKLKDETFVAGLWAHYIKLPKHCCPQIKCPHRTSSSALKCFNYSYERED